MAQKSFSEGDCATVQSWGLDRTLQSHRGQVPVSAFTTRSLQQVRRPGGIDYQRDVMPRVASIDDHNQAVSRVVGCDQCYVASPEALARKEQEFEDGFTRNNQRDTTNERMWALQMQAPAHAVRSKADLARLLEAETRARCAPYYGGGTAPYGAGGAIRLGQTLPLFSDSNDDSQRIVASQNAVAGSGDRCYQYRLGATKDFQGHFAQTLSQNRSLAAGAPTLAADSAGQFTRNADAASYRFCRGDFASNLPPSLNY